MPLTSLLLRRHADVTNQATCGYDFLRGPKIFAGRGRRQPPPPYRGATPLPCEVRRGTLSFRPALDHGRYPKADTPIRQGPAIPEPISCQVNTRHPDRLRYAT